MTQVNEIQQTKHCTILIQLNKNEVKRLQTTELQHKVIIDYMHDKKIQLHFGFTMDSEDILLKKNEKL